MGDLHANMAINSRYTFGMLIMISLSTCIALIPVANNWQWIKFDLFLLSMLYQYLRQRIRRISPLLTVCLGLWLTMLYPYHLGALSMLYLATHLALCVMENKAKKSGYSSMLLDEVLLIAFFHCVKLCVFSASFAPEVLGILKLAVAYHLVLWLILRAVTVHAYVTC